MGPALYDKSSPVLIGIVLVTILVGVSFTPSNFPQVKADWTYPSGYDPHGGYVDRLRFVVYPSENISDALLALQNGSIYCYDGQISYRFLAELEANEAIEVTSQPGATIWFFVFPSYRFPFNLTGYRRALAYSFDKLLAVQNARGGFAQAMDSPIPSCYPFWTYENQMTSHFYTEDIASANATLDAAHIIDTPDSPHPGWRYYDADMSGNWTAGDKRGDVLPIDGLKAEIWTQSGDLQGIQTSRVLAEGMAKCGLNAEVVEVDFINIYNRSGEPGICLFNWVLNPPGDFVNLFNFFHSPSYYYSPWYSNSGYDYNCFQLKNAPTRFDARDWAWNCCRILIQEMPMIVCYNDENTHAYRTDIWEGYVPQIGVNCMGGNPFTYSQIRLKNEFGGPFGCFPTEYVSALLGGISTTSIIRRWYFGGPHWIFELFYSRLWSVDPLDPQMNVAPDLAWNWTVEPTMASGVIQDGQKLTFHLYKNITWHDGTPFTSADVQYSLLSIHPESSYLQAPLNPRILQGDVTNIYRIDTPDPYTVEIYTNQTGYFEFFRSTYPYILPKHIWEPHEVEDFYWNPTTPLNLSGSGCFKWVMQTESYPRYIILDRYADWHFAIDHPPRIPCSPPPPPLWITLLVTYGVLIILIQVILLSILLYYRRKRQAKKEATS